MKLVEETTYQNNPPEVTNNHARINIPSIMCANCVNNIKKKINEFKISSEGVVDFNIDPTTKFLNITYNRDKVIISDILNILNDTNKPGILTEDLPINEKPKAMLHFTSKERLKGNLECIEMCKGVISAIPSSTFFHLRVFYDPSIIGARTLKDNILNKMPVTLSYTPKIGNIFDDIGEEIKLHKLKRNILISIPFSMTVFLIMMVLPHDALPLLNREDIPGISWKFFISFILTTPVHFWIGYPIHMDAYYALKNRSSNMSVLISLATNICYFYSLILLFYNFISSFFGMDADNMVFFETSAVLITFILIGRYIEAIVKDKTKNEINKLQGLQSDCVTVINSLYNNSDTTSSHSNPENKNENTNITKSIFHIELLELDDIVEVKEGSMIPSDGLIISNDIADIDESMITGESRSIPKSLGDRVIGGTICISGYINVKITHIGTSTILGQMISVLKSSSGSMSFEKIADKIGRIFVPIVVTLSLLTWIIWGILIAINVVTPSDHNSHISNSNDVLFVLEFGIAVLAIACPCALGLAAPTGTAVASGMAAKNSILIKRSNLFEAANKITHIVFDKTGTLTKGKPCIENSFLFGDTIFELREKWKSISSNLILISDDLTNHQESEIIHFSNTPFKSINKSNLSHEELVEFNIFYWTVLYSLEKMSGHHIAKAIATHAQNKFGIRNALSVTGFTIHKKDRSISGNIGKLKVKIGSFDALNFDTESAPNELDISGKQSQGSSFFLVKFDNLVVGAVELRDELRPEAQAAIDYFKKQKINVYICSGDQENTVKYIANSLGIDLANTFSQQSPFDKTEFVETLNKNGVVAMAGDGINDSLALSKSSLGIALGEVSNITSSAADIIIIKPNLSNLAYFFDLSRTTIYTIYRNYIWASIFNLVCIPLAAGILYPFGFILPPAVAGAIMAISSISVVLSSLLIKRMKFKELHITPKE